MKLPPLSPLLGLLKHQALLSSIQQVVSQGVNLKSTLRRIMLGVLAAVAGGIFILLAAGAGLAALYVLLTTQYFYSAPAALGIVALVALTPALILMLVARSLLKRKSPKPEETKPQHIASGPVTLDNVSQVATDAVNSFFRGLKTTKPKATIVRDQKTTDVKNDPTKSKFRVVR